mgnify:CR=1 FL=1
MTIVIAGGGNIGLYVARKLEERDAGMRVRLIEASRERAETLLPEVPVLEVPADDEHAVGHGRGGYRAGGCRPPRSRGQR